MSLANNGEHYPDLVLYRVEVRGRVPEAWLVDIHAGLVEVHSEPREGGYGAIRRYARGERVRSATLVDVGFEADVVLPG